MLRFTTNRGIPCKLKWAMTKEAMQKAIIRLCYRKIIDINASEPWDKFVFEDTYTEFLMQSQLYNQEKKYTSFSNAAYNRSQLRLTYDR